MDPVLDLLARVARGAAEGKKDVEKDREETIMDTCSFNRILATYLPLLPLRRIFYLPGSCRSSGNFIDALDLCSRIKHWFIVYLLFHISEGASLFIA